MLTLKTNLGDITLELDFKNTPKTAENFLTYAKNGFYDGTMPFTHFHLRGVRGRVSATR